MIRFTCSSCGKPFALRDELAGRQGKCSCGAVMTVPSPPADGVDEDLAAAVEQTRQAKRARISGADQAKGQFASAQSDRPGAQPVQPGQPRSDEIAAAAALAEGQYVSEDLADSNDPVIEAEPVEPPAAMGAPGVTPPAAAPQTAPAVQPPPLPNQAGPRWYLATPQGQTYGPVSKADLDAWYSQGRINAWCQLFQEGQAQWQPAATVYPALAQPIG